MSFFGVLIISNLKQSGDPEMLKIAEMLEEEMIQITLNKEDERLEKRPIWEKVEEGDGSEVLPRRMMLKLKEWGQV